MRRRRARLWMSCRLNLALMCCAATLAFFLMRLNLSFSLVCMVREIRYKAGTANVTSSTVGVTNSNSFGRQQHDISSKSDPLLLSSSDGELITNEQDDPPHYYSTAVREKSSFKKKEKNIFYYRNAPLYNDVIAQLVFSSISRHTGRREWTRTRIGLEQRNARKYVERILLRIRCDSNFRRMDQRSNFRQQNHVTRFEFDM